MKKKTHSSSETGFVALFFILTVASFLTLLINSLSHNFNYTLLMLDNFKKISHVRSAVSYCKYKLINNTLLDVEYTPVLDVDISTPYSTVCRYQSFRKISPQTREVLIVGGSTSTAPRSALDHSALLSLLQMPSFSIKYTYGINNNLYNYLQDTNVAQVR